MTTTHPNSSADAYDFSDLRAIYINCTLKRSLEPSHTQALADRSIAIMRTHGVEVEVVRAVDHEIATGVWPDMTRAWMGAPSYADEGSGGPDNDLTNRNTTFMTWNLLHTARMLSAAGGVPAHGNQRSEWDAGGRFDYPNPEHR